MHPSCTRSEPASLRQSVAFTAIRKLNYLLTRSATSQRAALFMPHEARAFTKRRSSISSIPPRCCLFREWGGGACPWISSTPEATNHFEQRPAGAVTTRPPAPAAALTVMSCCALLRSQIQIHGAVNTAAAAAGAAPWLWSHAPPHALKRVATHPTSQVSHGLQPQSQWRTPAAAVRERPLTPHLRS